MLFKHVILDRDGVLNREMPHGAYLTEPGQFQWLPGSVHGLALLRRSGVRISVATNQSGVGRGLMSLAALEMIHQRMQAEAAQGGGRLDAIFFCPHAPDASCQCRKPAPGLILAAIERSGIDPDESLVVGDDLRDLQAAERASLSAALVRTGKGRETEVRCRGNGVPTYDDLAQLAMAVAAGNLTRRRSIFS